MSVVVPAQRGSLDTDKALLWLADMLRFEEACAQLYTETKIRGFPHLYIGQEAVAVGTMAALPPPTALWPPTGSTGRRWPAAFR